MAVPLRVMQGDPLVASTALGKQATAMIKEGRGADMFKMLVNAANTGDRSLVGELEDPAIRTPPWIASAEAADRNNEPGRFTALIGWEWSSLPDAANLHRIVFMDGDAADARKFLPFHSGMSSDPEDLWAWLDKTEREVGAAFVAIPHNMNISKGRMFDTVDSKGRPIDAEYARTRIRWEPVAEVTQTKGDSETHPILSPEDEFAEFETYRHLIDTRPETDHTAPVTPGDYARSALIRGLGIARASGVNPYAFGMIGSTDSHTGLSSAEESNFHGKMAIDGIPEAKESSRLGDAKGAVGWDMSASGLAGVWAEENTRAAIVAAMKRKEVYATTGPRIRVRLFAGWDFRERDLKDDPARAGYARGVPMGGNLAPPPKRARAPTLLLSAQRDPKGANLDRIQVVKGWLDADGTPRERVYDAVASGKRVAGADGRLPQVGNSVDLERASYTNDIGAAELATVWTDPDFDPAQAALYYARVLEIPTPRHSLYDAVALRQQHTPNHPATIQERAYTSPVWYAPRANP
jgi:hypothetical protein